MSWHKMCPVFVCVIGQMQEGYDREPPDPPPFGDTISTDSNRVPYQFKRQLAQPPSSLSRFPQKSPKTLHKCSRHSRPPGCKTMYEKLIYFRDQNDSIRQPLLNEPRGRPAMCTNLILPPCHAGADAGFLLWRATNTRLRLGEYYRDRDGAA
ncbi:hypothetical protein BJX99DRAFT_256912 [Aspergillus californicus]